MICNDDLCITYQIENLGCYKEKGRGKEKEGRVRPPSLVQFGPDHGEGCGHLLRPISPFPYGPIRPIYSPANSRNSPVLRKIPESLGTFPISEYSLPIYRSLRLDHFETPRHVHDAPLGDGPIAGADADVMNVWQSSV